MCYCWIQNESSQQQQLLGNGVYETSWSSAESLQETCSYNVLAFKMPRQVLKQAFDNNSSKGLTVDRRSGRQSQTRLTDLDYADNITLIVEHVSSVQELLISLDMSAAKLYLTLNAKKTEYLIPNEEPDHPHIRSMCSTD